MAQDNAAPPPRFDAAASGRTRFAFNPTPGPEGGVPAEGSGHTRRSTRRACPCLTSEQESLSTRELDHAEVLGLPGLHRTREGAVAPVVRVVVDAESVGRPLGSLEGELEGAVGGRRPRAEEPNPPVARSAMPSPPSGSPVSAKTTVPEAMTRVSGSLPNTSQPPTDSEARRDRESVTAVRLSFMNRGCVYYMWEGRPAIHRPQQAAGQSRATGYGGYPWRTS